jgi:hypothetical protein
VTLRPKDRPPIWGGGRETTPGHSPARRSRSTPAGVGLTHGHIANLASGHERPSRRALELRAAAFERQPGYFAEHRLAELREQLDERRVGFDAHIAATAP